LKKYLEFIGIDAQRKTSDSRKFWEVEVKGKTVFVRYGRIGSEGVKTVKEFATKELAEQFSEKSIKEKIKKGYSEKSGGSVTTDLESGSRELLAAAEHGPGGKLTAIYEEHGFEEEVCERCEWVAEWLFHNSDYYEYEHWILEAILRNSKCPDSLLRILIDEFRQSPAAWGLANFIPDHPKASPETIRLATEYLDGPRWDE
jgi:predicted DNA-binding WGR domain protein